MRNNFSATGMLPSITDHGFNVGGRSAVELPEAVLQLPSLPSVENGAAQKGVPPSALND